MGYGTNLAVAVVWRWPSDAALDAGAATAEVAAAATCTSDDSVPSHLPSAGIPAQS